MKFNDGSPADNGYSIFDLKTKKIIKENLVAHGVFGAVFLSDGVSVFLDTGEGYIINIKAGNKKKIDINMLDNLTNFSEKCIKPKGWKYDKFQ